MLGSIFSYLVRIYFDLTTGPTYKEFESIMVGRLVLVYAGQKESNYVFVGKWAQHGMATPVILLRQSKTRPIPMNEASVVSMREIRVLF